MHWIDWIILIGCLALLTGGALWTSRYMLGVADFLAANRSGGRYLLSIARGMSSFGAVSIIAAFEVHHAAGFPPIWWQLMRVPIPIIIALSGWVYYRFRETRSFTLAQFYEMRYSKFTRIYAGIVAWIAGVVNFGIFPAVAARFFIYFCDLGSYPVALGPLEVDLIFAGVTAFSLAIALLYTCLGGQITVMVADCVLGIFTSILFIVLAFYLLHRFAWADVASTLMTAPAGKSMLNPYDTVGVKNFNMWFYLIDVAGAFYIFGSWQGSQGYDTSALSPHEQKMSTIIGGWRTIPLTLLMVLIPVCMLAFMRLDVTGDQATAVTSTLASIDNQAIKVQMTVPLALSQVLPVGLKGLFCVAMLCFMISTQDTYLHSWGSIFVQDIILPFRKTPFTPRHHLLLLQLSIISVAVFAFVFSLLFDQRQYILMFFAITAAVISGAGAMLIGGLYWTRGTAAGACTALTIGWLIPVAKLINGQLLARLYDGVPAAQRSPTLQAAYWFDGINDQYIWFGTMIACIGCYVIVSLLTLGRPADLDRIFNRGKYAIPGEHVEATDAAHSIWWRIFGISQEFSRTDRWVTIVTVGWNFVWFGVFLIGTLYNWLVSPLTDTFWVRFWQIWIWTNLLVSLPTVLWFSIGAVKDIRDLFARLGHIQRDDADMGMVAPEPPA